MSAGQIIDIAKQASAEQLGAAKAGSQFASELENTPKVDVILTPKQRKELETWIGFTPAYTYTKSVVHDHSVLCAMRDLARDWMMKELGQTRYVPTVFVGCAGYEFTNPTLFQNPAFKFSIHTAMEPKDVTRIVPPLLVDYRRKLRARLSDVDRAHIGSVISKDASKALKRFIEIDELVKSFRVGDFSKQQKIIMGLSGQFSRAVSFDSCYNWYRSDYLKAFSSMGLYEMWVVGFFPYELVFEDMPENNIYGYREFSHLCHTKAAVHYRGGYCNGYVHSKEAWSTLMRNTVIRLPEYGFAINVEIVASYGPMRVFKLTRCTHSSSVYRVLELPDHLRYVRVLDLVETYKRKPAMTDRVYFSVYAVEWWSLADYLTNIDPKSVTVPNAVAFIRRNKAGVSMAGKDYSDPWSVAEDKVLALAVAGAVYASGCLGDALETIENTHAMRDKSVNWKSFLSGCVRVATTVLTLGAIIPMRKLVRWFFDTNLFEFVVLSPSMEKVSFEDLSMYPHLKDKTRAMIAIDMEDLAQGDQGNPMGPKYDGDGKVTWLGSHPDCGFCKAYLNSRAPDDKQLIVCNYKPDSTVDWSMSSEECAVFKNELITQSTSADCPDHLKTVLENAYRAIPAGGVKWKGRVEVVKAGPGCGKSHALRAFYDDDTLVYAPFSKLRSDYMNQSRPDGSKYDMLFKTTHKGMVGYGKRKVCVDEWTAMSFNPMLVALHNNGASSLALFGDRRQTCIQASEGVFPGLKFRDEDLSSHELMVHFRGGQWIAAVLNLDLGYSMYCHSDEVYMPEVHPLSEAASVTDYKVMTFANLSAEYTASQVPESVRSNQGQTEDDIGIIVSDRDRNLIMNDQLFRVGISRQRRKLHIFVEPGTEMEALIRSKLHLDDGEFLSRVGRLSRPDMTRFVRDGNEGEFHEELMRELGLCDEKDPEELCSSSSKDEDTLCGDDGSEWEWCSADVVEAKWGPIAREEYMAFVRARSSTYVKDGLISLSALEEYANGRSCRFIAEMQDGTKYKSKFCPFSTDALYVEVQSLKTPLDHVVYLSNYDMWLRRPRKWSFRGEGDDKVRSVTCAFSKLDKAINVEFRTYGMDHEKFGFLEVTQELLSVWEGKIKERYESDMECGQPFCSPVIEVPRAPPDSDPNSLTDIVHWKVTFAGRDDMVSVVARPKDLFRTVQAVVDGLRTGIHEWTRAISVDCVSRYLSSGEYSIHVPSAIRVGRWKWENALVEVTRAVVPTSQQIRMMTYLNRPMESFAPRCTLPPRLKHKERPLQSGRDAFLFGDTMTPIHALGYHMRFLNEDESKMGFGNLPRTGTMVPSWIFPINARGHPVADTAPVLKGRALTIGEGLKYFGSSYMQSLHCVAHRYLRRRKVFRFNNQAKTLARKIAKNFQKLRMNPVKIDVHKEADIIREWEFASLKRSYARRAEAESEWDSAVIRFHLKDIFKPTKDIAVPSAVVFKKIMDLNKPGQGISAWSADANILFGAATRITNHRFIDSLNETATFNNKFTQEELDDILKEKLKRILPGAKTAVTDGADFDSMQNLFTQEIERCHSEFLLVPQMVLDAYYLRRNGYRLTQSGLFSAVCGSEKTSGEPGTLLYNSEVGGSMCDYVAEGIGPSNMELQGDDGKKTQVGIRVLPDRIADIARYSHFKLKCDIGENNEFCGDVEIQGTLVPSISRLFKKVCAHTEKSEKTFYEYKMSILDKIARIERVGAETAIAAGAGAYKCSYNEMTYMYDFIKSYAHLKWEEFLQVSIPVYGPTGGFAHD